MSRFKVKGIVVHLSASRWGDAGAIDEWHKARGWSGIGYHKVILNGCRSSNLKYDSMLDGKIQNGRPEGRMGAHVGVGGINMVSLGVCCIGLPGFPPREAALARTVHPYLTINQWTSLIDCLARLCERYDLDPTGKFKAPNGKKVFVLSQHSEHDRGKPLCASLVMPLIRGCVKERIAGG